jgi:DNA-binding IclR family transcriptional regulator
MNGKMPKSDLVQSLSRGLEIIRTVAGSDDGLTLAQLSESLGVKAPTAHNLARTLVAHNFLEKSTRPTRYRIGAALGELYAARLERALVREAVPVVASLYRDLAGATVTFCEDVGGQVVTRLRMSPDRGGVLERPRERMMHPYGAAASLVFQAYWPADRREAFRRRFPFWEYGAHLWGDEDRLEEMLKVIRRHGLAVPEGLGNKGLLAAGPVMGPGEELLGTLGVSFPAEARIAKTKRRAVEKRLKEALGELSSSIE